MVLLRPDSTLELKDGSTMRVAGPKNPARSGAFYHFVEHLNRKPRGPYDHILKRFPEEAHEEILKMIKAAGG